MSARDVWRRMRGTATQALSFSVGMRLLSFAVLAPLVSLAGRGLLALSGRNVVANADILAFVLTPLGLVSIAIIGILTAGLVLLRFVGEQAIAYGAFANRSVSWRDAARVVVGSALPVLHLGFAVMLRLAVFAVAFVGIAFAAKAWLLGAHDINYYLTVQPPEFYSAVAIASVAGAGLGAVAAKFALGWTFALPLVALRRVAVSEALRVSATQAVGQRWRLLLAFVVPPAIALAIVTLVTVSVHWVAAFAFEAMSGGLRASAWVLGFEYVVDGIVAFVGSVGASIAIAHALAAVHAEAVDELPQPGAEGGLPSADWRPGFVSVTLAVVGITVAAGIVAGSLLSGITTPDDVRNIAHRAGAAHGPENSLAALRAAIEAGADLAEIDVQRTADDAVVVVHDRDLMKLAGLPQQIGASTLAELKQADIGDGERVATLEEFLATAGDDIGLCVELKYYGWDEMLAPRVLQILRHAGALDRCEVMSLEVRAVQQVRQLAPEVRLGYLSAVAIGSLLTVDADFIAVAASGATTALIAAARAAGRDVYAWTLNDAASMSAAVDRGVFGVITDDPPLLVETLTQRAALSQPERLVLRFGAETR